MQQFLEILHNSADKSNIELDLQKKIQEFELLSDFGTRLNQIRTVEEVYYELGQELVGLLPRTCIIITGLEEDSRFAKIKKIYGERGNLKRIIDLLEINPTNLLFDTQLMSPSDLAHFTRGKLTVMEEGIHLLLNRQISLEKCRQAEKKLGITQIESMGFSFNGCHKGGVSLLLKDRAVLANRIFIESLIKQAAISIDRLRAENRLRENEKKYRELVEKAGLAIAIDNQEGSITYFNQEFAKIFGYSAEEMHLQSHPNLCHPDDLPWIDRFHNARMLGEYAPEEYEFRGLRKDGKVIWLMVKTAQVVQLGQVTGTRNYFWDITERKLNEIALQEAKEKAEESDRLKSAFLKNLSHEIRTPMNGIMGFSSMLEEDGLSTRSRSEYIRIINRNGEQLLRIIDDIIDISKLESGQLSACKEQFGLHALLENIRTVYAEKCESKSLIFKTLINSDTPEIFISDPYKIKRILHILLSNAIKFTTLGHIYLKIQPDREKPNRIRFEIEDTGSGIAPESQGSIFERFSKELTDSAIRNGGTGLGLAIAKGLTELLGGSIGLTSEKGKGSQFYFSIPIET